MRAWYGCWSRRGVGLHGGLSGLSATVERLRLGLEGKLERTLGTGTLGAFGQLSGRHDGGDGVAGSGVEIAGGIRYGNGRLTAEFGGRYLGMYSVDDWGEVGYHLSLKLGAAGGRDGLDIVAVADLGRVVIGTGVRRRCGVPRRWRRVLAGGPGSGLSGGFGGSLGGGGLSGGLAGGGLESNAGYGLRLPGAGAPLLTLHILHSQPAAEPARTGLGLALADWQHGHHGLNVGLSLERLPAARPHRHRRSRPDAQAEARSESRSESQADSQSVVGAGRRTRTVSSS